MDRGGAMKDLAVGAVPTASYGLREDFLASSFAKVLKREFVDVDADFFALGGDSLGATLVLAEIRERLDASMSARTFFDLRTVEKLALAIPRQALGLDAEDLVADGRARPAVHSAVHRLHPDRASESVDSASSIELGQAARRFARTSSLAPSVVYLCAWTDVLAGLEQEVFPLQVELGDERADSWSITAPRAFVHDHSIGDLALLQKGLLSPELPESRTALSSFYYTRQPRNLETVRHAGSNVACALLVRDGPTTTFELVRRGSAAVPTTLLQSFMQRLDELIERAPPAGSSR